MQCKTIADDMVNSAVHDQESVDMEILWSAVDRYRESIVLTKEKDVEFEAIGYSCLGKIYK